jgi:curved DNA-binding protein CbpA
MGLRAPCTEEDVKRVYRCLAEQLHPDRGGDTRRFLLLQEQFEKALHYVRELQPSSPTTQAR